MAWFHNEWSVHALRLHPCVEVLERVFGFLDVVGHIHQVGVNDIAPQVLPKCLAQLVVIFGE